MFSLAFVLLGFTTECKNLPCSASLNFTATIVDSRSLALEETTLPSGERLIVAVESCSGCVDPAARTTRWLASAEAPVVYRYGQGLAELHGDRWYASRRFEPDHLLAGGP